METEVAPRFFLRTLGTLRVTDAAGQPALGDHGHQRRRLALLAVLAAAGDQGRSRDQILALFWPEVDQSRARHSLEQLIYSLRNTLGADLFSGSNPLRLNPDVIASDIGSFMEAIRRGDLAAAVGLYQGRFADGFYLGGAPEFEQWMDTERNRTDAVFTGALEKLAESAETAGELTAAAGWRAKLADADPLSSKHATNLIRALMNAGDYSTALQHAERYEALVARELGTGVGPAMAALVTEVRENARTESVVVRGTAPAPARLEIQPPVQQAPVDYPKNDVPRSRPVLRTPLYVIILALVAAAAGYAGWRQLSANDSPGSAVNATSIAVLPFANLSGDPRDSVIADGITEELIGALSRVDRLKVIARTSAFMFRNSALDVRQIAESLHVSHVLEGGVQKIGERLRVQIRLIDARDGSTRWSEVFDRTLSDMFVVQGEIATAVARELDLRLTGSGGSVSGRAPTRSIAAYELYLRGDDPTLLRSDSTVRVGLEYFRQATELDSSYAAAYAGIARMHLRLRGTAYAAASPQDMFSLANQYADKAVALDSLSAEAHGSVGLVKMNSFDFPAAETSFKRAVELDPASARLREWLFIVYDWQDRHNEMLAEARRAVELDPLSPGAHATLGRALCINGQTAAGIAMLNGLASLRPPLLRVRMFRALCQGMKGDWQGGIETLSAQPGMGSTAVIGNFLARNGNREQALRKIRELEEHRKREGGAAFEIAVVYAGLGEKDLFFEWLDRSIGEASIFPSMTEPLFDRVRDDPRFDNFLRRGSGQKR